MGKPNKVKAEEKPKVEGDTDKEKVQKMAEMTDQIYNTVDEIWADSYQREDMMDSLSELKRIFDIY